MQRIGKKIKELRVSNGLTQENLISRNPSQISQIESGKIKKPTEPTLRGIAKELKLEFEDLIDGTDWSPGRASNINMKYVYSPIDVVVNLDIAGKITAKLKSYPRQNHNGHENNYCPSTGVALLISCKKCSRPYDNDALLYCMGCGYEIKKYQIIAYNIKNKLFCQDVKANLSEVELVKESIEKSDSSIDKTYNYYDIYEERDYGSIAGKISEENDDAFFDDFMENNQLWHPDIMWEEFNDKSFNWESFRLKHKSPNRLIKDIWCQHYQQISYYNGILEELKRYEMNILHDVSQHKTSKKVKKSKQEEK